MLTYPVTLTPGEQGLILATAPDLPEMVCCGDCVDSAIARAGDILDIILAGYSAEGRPIPRPSLISGAPTVTTEYFSRP